MSDAIIGKLFQSKWLALLKALLPKDLHFGFQNCQHKFEIHQMDRSIWYKYFKLYNINNGVATPLLCVERGDRRGGDPISPFYLSLVLPSNRIKVIIRKGIRVSSSLLQMIWRVSFTTKMSDVIHFLIAHIRMMNAQDWRLTRTEKKPIGLMGTQFLLQWRSPQYNQCEWAH